MTNTTSTQFTSVWIPARQNLSQIRLTCTPRMMKSVKPIRLTKTRSWCWAVVQTVSVKVSSLTTAVYTPRLHCVKMVTKPSWLTVTQKPYQPITTPQIASTLSL
ncbi:Uncharacterised protein [Vibrio cholerae]|nr:Uncharacterised protein [Vibrio cholerae]